MNEQILIEFLKKHSIPYHLYEHQPVFTTQDEPIVTAIDGVAVNSGAVPKPHFKSLFLKDTKGRFCLLSVIQDKRVDLKNLNSGISYGRFSFGKPEELLELLHLTPGSVTPFGLINDAHNKVRYVLDKDALNYAHVTFHPLRNDQMIVMNTQDFLRCMQLMDHEPLIIAIPTR